MSFNVITHPTSGIQYSIFSNPGRNLLKNYLRTYKSGGDTDDDELVRANDPAYAAWYTKCKRCGLADGQMTADDIEKAGRCCKRETPVFVRKDGGEKWVKGKVLEMNNNKDNDYGIVDINIEYDDTEREYNVKPEFVKRELTEDEKMKKKIHDSQCKDEEEDTSYECPKNVRKRLKREKERELKENQDKIQILTLGKVDGEFRKYEICQDKLNEIKNKKYTEHDSEWRNKEQKLKDINNMLSNCKEIDEVCNLWPICSGMMTGQALKVLIDICLKYGFLEFNETTEKFTVIGTVAYNGNDGEVPAELLSINIPLNNEVPKGREILEYYNNAPQTWLRSKDNYKAMNTDNIRFDIKLNGETKENVELKPKEFKLPEEPKKPKKNSKKRFGLGLFKK